MSEYSEKLQHPKWQRIRTEVLKRDKYKCLLCGETEIQLQIHHLEYHGVNPWDTPKEKLKTLCKVCHPIVEVLKKYTFEFPNKAIYFEDIITGKICGVALITKVTVFIFDTNTKNLTVLFSKNSINKINKFCKK